MDGESHSQRLRPAANAWSRPPYAAWTTIFGIVLSLATIIVSALNAISSRQAFAMAVPAVLITIGGLVGRIVPDPLTAWRRGFRHGCEAARISRAWLEAADAARDKSGEIQLAEMGTHPAKHYCEFCGRKVMPKTALSPGGHRVQGDRPQVHRLE
jgi:hypothetical protein